MGEIVQGLIGKDASSDGAQGDDAGEFAGEAVVRTPAGEFGLDFFVGRIGF